MTIAVDWDFKHQTKQKQKKAAGHCNGTHVLKEFFEKVDFEKKSADTKKHKK